MAAQVELVTGSGLVATATREAPLPPGWRGVNRIAAWLPTGDFHRLFPGYLVYEAPGERRYFIPAGSRVWNYSSRGWTSWITKSSSYKRFIEGRWWNETTMRESQGGRYYDIASPVHFLPHGVAYVDLYLDVEKRRGRIHVVDRDEWNAFVRSYPLAPDINSLVEFGMREASHFGPSSWRAALDRMEGECRRWVRDAVREGLAELGIEPNSRALAPEVLDQLLAMVEQRTGARLSRPPLARVPAAELGRHVFQLITREPVSAARVRRGTRTRQSAAGARASKPTSPDR
jgi:protein associated with RNAse G/E